MSVQGRAPADTAPAAARIAAALLFVLYLALLLRLTVFRDSFSLQNFMQGGDVNLVPLRDLIKVIKRGGSYYFVRLLLGNIAAFVPLGAYLAFVCRKDLAAITLIGCAASIAVEILQFVFDVGITELDDVLLNTLGAFLGAATVRLCFPVRR